MIGFVGKKSSGKDTSGDYLVEKYGFEKQSFAYPLKKCCKEMFALTDAQLNDPILKETPDPRWYGATPRQILQFVGTDLFRNQLETIMPNIGNSVHINAFKLWYDNNKDKKIVLCDVRFLNEADMIKKSGGTLIRVNRGENKKVDLHQSEIELDQIKCDYIIDNNDSLDKLYEKLDNIMKQ